MSESTWYSPAEFRYRRKQVCWALDHYIMMEHGRWPAQATGYTEAPRTQASLSQKAPFVTALEVIAEIERRLDKCGRDGLMVRLYYQAGVKIEDIAKLAGLCVYDVEYHMERAVAYTSSGMTPRWVANEYRPGRVYDEWHQRHLRRYKNARVYA
jgi:hypothetical protein